MGTVDLLILIGGLVIAGLAKGVTGMGLPLIATPVLAGVFGPRLAVVVITIPILVANSLLVMQGWRRLRELRGIRLFVLAGVVGSAIGTQALARLDQRTFAILITCMVAVFLVGGDRLLGEDPAAGRARVGGPIIGLVGGMIQGTTSISAPLVGSYFHARRFPPADFVVTVAMCFEANAAAQVVGYWAAGLYTPETLSLGIVSCIPALLALAAGIALRGKLDAVRFRKVIVGVLIVSVVNLLWRSFLA